MATLGWQSPLRKRVRQVGQTLNPDCMTPVQGRIRPFPPSDASSPSCRFSSRKFGASEHVAQIGNPLPGSGPHQIRPSLRPCRAGISSWPQALGACSLLFPPQAVRPPPPAQGHPSASRDWRGRNTMETMRVLTISSRTTRPSARAPSRPCAISATCWHGGICRREALGAKPNLDPHMDQSKQVAAPSSWACDPVTS